MKLHNVLSSVLARARWAVLVLPLFGIAAAAQIACGPNGGSNDIGLSSPLYGEYGRDGVGHYGYYGYYGCTDGYGYDDPDYGVGCDDGRRGDGEYDGYEYAP